MEDSSVWENIKAGDKQALKALYVKYFHQMCLFAQRHINDPGLVEELVSDCFIKIWENRKKIQIKVSVKNYVYLMLRNSIVDFYRKKQVVCESIDNFPEIADEAYFDEQKQYVQLYKALSNLPQQRRKILEFAVFDALTYNEIAEKLGISRNTVKTQIARAYRFLKETLDPKDFYLLMFSHQK